MNAQALSVIEALSTKDAEGKVVAFDLEALDSTIAELRSARKEIAANNKEAKKLNINEEDFNTLSECTKGIEPKACTTDKITVKEANEATSYIPRFVILINN